MEALLVSTSIVALAEMGDKTQPVLRPGREAEAPGPDRAGDLFATLANHFLAGWIGAWLRPLVSPTTLPSRSRRPSMAFGLWALQARRVGGRPAACARECLRSTTLSPSSSSRWATRPARHRRPRRRLRLARRGVMGTDARHDDRERAPVWMGEALATASNMKWMGGWRPPSSSSWAP